MEHRLAVVGSREFGSKALILEQLSELLTKTNAQGDTLVIISGGAKGADSMAKIFADCNGLECVEHLPDWDRFGKSAGFKRNHTIWNDATCGIAFWDGVSKGTEHSFKIAKDQNKSIKIITLNITTQRP